MNYEDENLEYIHQVGEIWQAPETVDSNDRVGWYSTIALDSNGNPHISYYDTENENLKYAFKDGNDWQDPETIDDSGNVGWYTSIALDSNNRPHISYYDWTNKSLKCTYKDTTRWQTPETVDSSSDAGKYTSIAIDSNNYPHISYRDSDNNLKYSYKDSSGWHTIGIDSSTGEVWYTSIVLDSDDRPHISYSHINNNNSSSKILKYAYFENINWEIETVDDSKNVGEYSSIALDSNDDPHISYYDANYNDLRYTFRNNNGWKYPRIVDSVGDVGWYTSIVLDPADNPHISYYDNSNGYLKYASNILNDVPFASTTTSVSGGGNGGSGGSASGTTTTTAPQEPEETTTTTTTTVPEPETTTTTVPEPETTTTTTVRSELCVIEQIVGEDQPSDLVLFRLLRDRWMAQVPQGSDVISQYYVHSSELTSILFSDPTLLAKTQQIVFEGASILKDNLGDRNDILLTESYYLKIKNLLRLIHKTASPDLQKTISILLKKLDSDEMIRQMGVKIVQDNPQ
jgi:hypothetical protein